MLLIKKQAQHTLLSLIETLKKKLNKKEYGGGVLMDLSRAINYDFLQAKVHAYGFTTKSLTLIKSYITRRWQRTKANTSFISWSELLLEVPQGSVLEPSIFNIYLNDLFYLTEYTNVCSYADDTTFHACDSDLKVLISRLEHDSLLTIEWKIKRGKMSSSYIRTQA